MSAPSAMFENNRKNLNRHGALWWRIGALLILVIAFVLVLITFLNYSNYRKTWLGLNQARYLVLAKDLRQTVEAGLNIGLRPSENLRLLPGIKELARQQPGIRYIAIIDKQDQPIVEGNIPPHIANEWKTRLAGARLDSFWRAGNADTFELGMPFTNNFNITAGAVVIGYDRLAIERATDKMLRELGIDVLATLSCLVVLTFASVYLITRQFSRELKEVAAAISGTLSAATPPIVSPEVLGGGVAGDINEFTALSHKVVRKIAQLEQDIALSSRMAGSKQERPT